MSAAREAEAADEPPLAEALCEQRLADDVVRLVSAAVQQVLTLQEDLQSRRRREPRRVGQRRRSPCPRAELCAERALELGAGDDASVRGGQLLQSVPEQLGSVAAAEGAEGADPRPCRFVGVDHSDTSALARTLKNAESSFASLTPGADSTPLLTSTPQGR